MRKNIGKAVSAPAWRERARGIRTGGARMSRVEIGLWQLEVRAKKCVEALRKNGFDAGFYPHAESLRTRVLAECERAESIGFGGSLSIQDLGIFEALEGKGKRLLDQGRRRAEKHEAAETFHPVRHVRLLRGLRLPPAHLPGLLDHRAQTSPLGHHRAPVRRADGTVGGEGPCRSHSSGSF